MMNQKDIYMASPESQRIKRWLVQNIKNAPLPASIQEARVHLEGMSSWVPLPADTRVEHVMAGSVPGEWVSSPDADPANVILCLHGGGYTMGSSKATHVPASWFSIAAKSRVLVIDYRLAPEHPFPAALEDAIAAYRWLLDQGIPGRRIVIIGLSAGGGLALSLLVSLRDAGIPLPAGAVLISPWTDLVGTGSSVVTLAGKDPWLTDAMNKYHAALYAGGKDLHHPLISPVYADFHGLPPLLIHVGSDEIMLDDSQRVADKAKAAGVAVTLEIWEGMWHVWHAFATRLPEAQQAIDRIGEFIRQTITHP
jgi:monoterpene epsilon-lactone hydrolase